MNQTGSNPQRQPDGDQTANLSPELQEVLHMLNVIEQGSTTGKPAKR
jgi:hypothetical protein